MANARKKRTNNRVANADGQSPLIGETTLSDTDVARRAFELYSERGGQHGRDVEDWLRAEIELRTTLQGASA